MRVVCITILLLMAPLLEASERWQFTSRTAVGSAPQPGVFHHLEGAGRKHIALSANRVAIVWEDDSSGNPQIYLAVKNTAQQQFMQPLQVSDGKEAYEPAITAISDGRFILVYEQDGIVFARLWTEQGLSKALRLSQTTGAQASVASFGNTAMVVWREKQQSDYFLRLTQLDISHGTVLTHSSIHSVEQNAVKNPILMPTIMLNDTSVCVAWEDRRAGHTRLLYSYSAVDSIQFSEPASLNEFFSNRNEYDKGNGVTRVSIAAVGEDEILAGWMDKRRGSTGYGIYSAMGAEGGASFGPNEKVHAQQGDEQPHYNPAVAGNLAGDFVVVWDDFRKGNSDIWLSSYNDDDEWSQDHAPIVASGNGEQTHPSAILDEQGGLHLVWVERKDSLSATRLWYSYASASGE